MLITKRNFIYIFTKKYKNSGIPAGEIKILNFLQIFCKKHNYKLFLLGRNKYDAETKKNTKKL